MALGVPSFMGTVASGCNSWWVHVRGRTRDKRRAQDAYFAACKRLTSGRAVLARPISKFLLVVTAALMGFDSFYKLSLQGHEFSWFTNMAHIQLLAGYHIASMVCLLVAALVILRNRPYAVSPAVRGGSALAAALVAARALLQDLGENEMHHGGYNGLVFAVCFIPGLAAVLAAQSLVAVVGAPRLVRAALGLLGAAAVLLYAAHFPLDRRWGAGLRSARLRHDDSTCPIAHPTPWLELLPRGTLNFWAGTSEQCAEADRLRAAPPASRRSLQRGTGGDQTRVALSADWAGKREEEEGMLRVEVRCAGGWAARADLLPDTRTVSQQAYWKKTVEHFHPWNATLAAAVDLHVEQVELVRVAGEGAEEGVEVYEGRVRDEGSVTSVVGMCTSTGGARAGGHTAQRLATHVGFPSAPRAQELRAADAGAGAGGAGGVRDVVVVFLDAVSRHMFTRRLPRASAALEAIDRSGAASLHQMFKYGITGFSTDKNTRNLFCGGDPHARAEVDPGAGARRPFWEHFAAAGVLTALASDWCEDWGSEYINRTASAVDYEFIAPFCRPPYYPLDAYPLGNFVGAYSVRRRCSMGADVHHHIFDFLEQFLANGAVPAGMPRLAHVNLIEGHEGTGEVLPVVDERLAQFLEGLAARGRLNDTAVLLLSDHGLHMGIPFVFGSAPQLEHKLPTMTMLLPPRLTAAHPLIREALDHNSQALVASYDFFATMQHLLAIIEGRRWNPKQAGVRWGNSLFEKVPPGRTCSQAGIPKQHCPCANKEDHYPTE